MTKTLIIGFLTAISFISVGQTPKSIFSHIEIVLDSTEFKGLVANTFIRENLGICSYDTLQPNPLVVSYFIRGSENFIHFNPNKGYFQTQKGTAYLIFQSTLPGQGSKLERAWKSVTKDSLLSYDYEHPDFTLSEIIYKEHGNLRKRRDNCIIPMLSSYSQESYKKWGFGESSDVSMKQFIGLDSVSTNRAFAKILSIKLMLTQQELDQLANLLTLIGYNHENGKFNKPDEPAISYTLSKSDLKVKEIELSMNNSKVNEKIVIGNITLIMDNNVARLIFK